MMVSEVFLATDNHGLCTFYRFRCNICDKKILCDHMGKPDVIRHSKTKSHQEQARSLRLQPRLSFTGPSSTETSKRTEAELKMAVLTASSNVSLAFHDQLSPTIRKVFSDSKIAASYHSASTKAMCMLNRAVASVLKEDLIANMKLHPFSISIDGSNDTGLEKMYPAAVRIFDINCGRVATRFLDMCTTSSSTAEGIFTVLNGKLVELLDCANPWDFCTSVGVDNTSVNIGTRNSLKTRIVEKNPAIFFNGCPCHIIHNAARKASEAFCESCGFDIEEFTINLYYWFDKSTKRKIELQSYCSFCDQAYRAIIKHVSTRWLSLELAIERALKQFPSLKSYFMSESQHQARFERLQRLFEDPMTELYLMFFQSILPVFTHANRFLQREEPLIHVLHPQLTNLLKKIYSNFIKPSVIADCIRDLPSLKYKESCNQVDNDHLIVGFITLQKAKQLLDNGDISERQYDTFFCCC